MFNRQSTIKSQDEEIVQAVETICKNIGTRYVHGYMEFDDICSYAYTVAIQSLPRYVPESGTLFNFLYSVIQSRLHNLMRDNLFRQSSPCKEGCECDSCRKNRHLDVAKKTLGRAAYGSADGNAGGQVGGGFSYFHEREDSANGGQLDQEAVDRLSHLFNLPHTRRAFLRYVGGEQLTKDEASILVKVLKENGEL